MHPSYSGTDGEGAAYGRPEKSGYLPAESGSLRKACGWRRCRPRERTSDTCPPRPRLYNWRLSRNDPMNIRYIENPTEKVQSVVLNTDRDAAPFISSPTEEIKRLAMEMYGLRLENAAGKQTVAARTSETSGNSGKKATEGVAKKPSAKQVREAVEKLDSEIQGNKQGVLPGHLRGAVLGQRRGTGKRIRAAREKQGEEACQSL